MWLQVLQQASGKVFVPLTVGGGIREFTDADGKHYSALDVAAEYFRSGADKVSIGGDAVFAAEEYLASGRKSGKSSIEQISWVRAHFLSSGPLRSVQPGFDLMNWQEATCLLPTHRLAVLSCPRVIEFGSSGD